MFEIVILTLCTFWAWETVRYPFERYAGSAYAALAPLHPLVVASLPLAVLWPNWIEAGAVAGAVGILHLATTRVLSQGTQAPVAIPRQQRAGRLGLPSLPR